jgi:hypothetical protein
VTLIAFASTPGGCTYYRAEMPARLLRAAGYDVAVSDFELEFGTEGGIAIPGYRDPDVVVMAAGWLRAHEDVIAGARAVGQKVIGDCDDWPWLPRSNPAWTADGAEHKLRAMRACDAIVTSTAYMQQGLAKHGIEAVLVRNLIDPTDYEPSRSHAQYDIYHPTGCDWCSKPAGVLTIGYRGVLAGFHDGDVATLNGHLPTEGVRYVHVGADPRARSTFAELAGVPPELVTNRLVQPFGPKYFGMLGGIDLALIPLRDCAFNRAKSNIAALEWTAAGVPWLAIGAATKHEFGLLDTWSADIELQPNWSGLRAGLDRRLTRQTECAKAFDVRTASAAPWLAALDRIGVQP